MICLLEYKYNKIHDEFMKKNQYSKIQFLSNLVFCILHYFVLKYICIKNLQAVSLNDMDLQLVIPINPKLKA